MIIKIFKYIFIPKLSDIIENLQIKIENKLITLTLTNIYLFTFPKCEDETKISYLLNLDKRMRMIFFFKRISMDNEICPTLLPSSSIVSFIFSIFIKILFVFISQIVLN